MNNARAETITYPCGCSASGSVNLPGYCAEHSTDPLADTHKILVILAEGLRHVMWHKECGCDFYDEKIGKYRNYPDVERDAMYRDAMIALEKCGLLQPATINEKFRDEVHTAIANGVE